MSKVEVDKIDPQSGTALEIGSSGDTATIPSGATFTIASGATLTNSGTATGFASIAWQSVVTGSTLTAVAGRGYPINTTSNACTVTLPASASVGDQIIFSDYLRTWATYAVTINQNSLKYQGNATPNPVYDTTGESVHIVYMDATQGWVPINDGAVAFETPQAYDAHYLVLAGGGAGGSAVLSDGYGRGGGGAGGYLTNHGGAAISFLPGITYSVTLGTGGSSTAAEHGGNGGNSVLSGSDITDVTATGGGGGGAGSAPYEDGRTGGSAGGGGVISGGGSASGGTATVSPSQGNDGGDGLNNQSGGGGGGAGAVGAVAHTTNYGGAGGNGLANTITGASVTYAGGGGGGGNVEGAGGTGGGGKGYDYSPQTIAVAGTNGLGGGGGGSGWLDATYPVGADGGDGVVILSVADGDYSGNTTGSPTVATDVGGTGKTTLTFTGDGTYIA